MSKTCKDLKTEFIDVSLELHKRTERLKRIDEEQDRLKAEIHELQITQENLLQKYARISSMGQDRT